VAARGEDGQEAAAMEAVVVAASCEAATAEGAEATAFKNTVTRCISVFILFFSIAKKRLKNYKKSTKSEEK